MIISTYKYNRETLTETQKDFFVKLVPFAIKMQEWTKLKSGFNHISSPVGIYPSVMLADVILTSTWGAHPISKAEQGGKYCNNLSLIEMRPGDKTKSMLYGTKIYRTYKDWSDWAVDYTDIICFSQTQELTLRCPSEEGQIKGFTIGREDYLTYRQLLKQTIVKYNLSEFNS